MSFLQRLWRGIRKDESLSFSVLMGLGLLSLFLPPTALAAIIGFKHLGECMTAWTVVMLAWGAAVYAIDTSCRLVCAAIKARHEWRQRKGLKERIPDLVQMWKADLDGVCDACVASKGGEHPSCGVSNCMMYQLQELVNTKYRKRGLSDERRDEVED